ncbi:CRISPR-associated endonuclease Cas3'' [Jannaschia rubra]|uniref:CRISPR-associated endonuclease Cas3'' n=1 Tax=Jannaschia rubra TaxID=282197 RepID=UPI002492AE5C|nr:CRISPR-associated endonuclease Cas3'' [Jannaschia rubra]
MIYAHSLDGRPREEWETLEAHARRVAAAARLRSAPFGAGDLAETLGLLHDLGKAKPGFQRKLDGEVNDTSHSGEGARALWSGAGCPLAAAIAGHHGRLPDPVDRNGSSR